MGWLRSVFKGPEKADSSELVAAAEQKWGDAASSMAYELETFIETEFGHLNKSYLGVLSDNLDDAINQTDHSPLLVARAEYAEFLEEAVAVIPMIRAEVMAHMKDWVEALTRIGVSDGVEQVANSRLESIQSELMSKGRNLFMERSDALNWADEKWRSEFPEQAKLEPRD